jgi:hypothetical protein
MYKILFYDSNDNVVCYYTTNSRAEAATYVANPKLNKIKVKIVSRSDWERNY